MSGKVNHTLTPNLYRNIVPRHPGLDLFINVRAEEVPGFVDVRDSEIAEVGSFP